MSPGVVVLSRTPETFKKQRREQFAARPQIHFPFIIKVIFEKKKTFFFKRGILRALISHMSCFLKRRRNVTRT